MTVCSQLRRDVLLGRATWRDLVAAGAEIGSVPGGWSFGTTPGDPLVVGEDDLRREIVTQSRALDHGREWAAFLLSAEDHFDLAQLPEGRSATGAQVLEALWDLSGGDPVRARQRLGLT